MTIFIILFSSHYRQQQAEQERQQAVWMDHLRSLGINPDDIELGSRDLHFGSSSVQALAAATPRSRLSPF